MDRPYCMYVQGQAPQRTPLSLAGRALKRGVLAVSNEPASSNQIRDRPPSTSPPGRGFFLLASLRKDLDLLATPEKALDGFHLHAGTTLANSQSRMAVVVVAVDQRLVPLDSKRSFPWTNDGQSLWMSCS